MNTMKKKLVALSVLLIACVIGIGQVAADELYIESHLSTLTTGNEGFVNAAGDRSTGGLGLALGYERTLSPAIGVRPLVIYDADGFDARRFDGDLDTRWARQRVMAGVDVGYSLLSWLRPIARLGLGYSYQSLQFDAGDEIYADGAHGLTGLAAGGFEIVIGRDLMGTDPISRLSLGLHTLFGYSFQTAGNFEAMTSEDAPEEPTDEDPWQRATYDAGSIGASGFNWNLGASLRYRF